MSVGQEGNPKWVVDSGMSKRVRVRGIGILASRVPEGYLTCYLAGYLKDTLQDTLQATLKETLQATLQASF